MVEDHWLEYEAFHCNIDNIRLRDNCVVLVYSLAVYLAHFCIVL